MFEMTTSVRLHDTDAAGLLFFAHQFRIAHDAYESFMEQIGYSFASIFREDDYLLPIVHAEADYTAILNVGDRLAVRLVAEKIGETSFTLAYDLINDSGKSVGTVRTVHVCLDKSQREKRPLPDGLRQALEAHH